MFSLSTAGLENAEDFPRRLREAIARGLSRADALAALTIVPARQLGLGQVLGSLEPGKMANLVIATGEPFAIGTRVSEIWIDGKRHELPEKKPRAGGRSERDASERDGKESPETPLAPDVRPFIASEESLSNSAACTILLFRKYRRNVIPTSRLKRRSRCASVTPSSPLDSFTVRWISPFVLR